MTAASDAYGGRDPFDEAASADNAEARKAAIAWYARLCSGEATDADRDAWRRWRGEQPEHERAWQRLEALQAVLQRVPGPIAATTLGAVGRQGRRRVLRSVVVLGGGGALAWLSWRFAAEEGGGWSSWLADYRTGVGEQRRIELADGSRLMLNTRSAIDVTMDAAQRRVRLRDGEILVETAKAPGGLAAQDARPFVVETVHGRIRALGTRFAVRTDASRTRVTLLADAAEIHADGATDRGVIVRAGQQTSFRAGEIGIVTSAEPASTGWTRGSLVVDDWRLEEVVAELARYRRGHLGCDPAVAGIRISGAFPLHDTDKALAVIAQGFPVRISRFTRYWVELKP